MPRKTKVATFGLFFFALTWAKVVCSLTSGDSYLTGKIFECETGAPLPGVVISTLTSQTFSNAEGFFKLEGLTASIHEVTFHLSGFESVRKSYDLSDGNKSNLTVHLVLASYESIVCQNGRMRMIALFIVDAVANDPIAFAFVSPIKRCSKQNGHVPMNCQPEESFYVTLDIKAENYHRWRHKVRFPPKVTNFQIALERK